VSGRGSVVAKESDAAAPAPATAPSACRAAQRGARALLFTDGPLLGVRLVVLIVLFLVPFLVLALVLQRDARVPLYCALARIEVSRRAKVLGFAQECGELVCVEGRIGSP
jgi:hypothetical protein